LSDSGISTTLGPEPSDLQSNCTCGLTVSLYRADNTFVVDDDPKRGTENHDQIRNP
jgi:hypothetical protein